MNRYPEGIKENKREHYGPANTENMMAEENVKVYGQSGKKICEIHCPQGWNYWIGIPLPFVTIFSVRKWTDPEFVRGWAWFQVLLIVSEFRQGVNLSGKSRLPCLVCQHDTVAPKVSFLWTKVFGQERFYGFRCLNKKCAMYNVLLPSEILRHADDVPWCYLSERDGSED